ncbi:MAG TPA: glutathione S-transferase C-terminal domain-containing protein [Solirubrobacteraceae bacterium]
MDEAQTRGMAQMLAARETDYFNGAQRLGWKVGFNTPQAMEALGIDAPIVGYLTNATLVQDGATISVDGFEGTPVLEQDRPRVLAAFDGIAERLQDGRPYLFGERFTAADLTFSALAAAAVVPPGYGTPLPQLDLLPEPVARDVRAFREHPAGAFALRMYERHRRAAAA